MDLLQTLKAKVFVSMSINTQINGKKLLQPGYLLETETVCD